MNKQTPRSLRPRWTIALLVLALLAVLEAVTRLGLVPVVILAAPTKVAQVLWQLVISGKVFPDLWRTTWEVMLSVALAIATGVPIGFGLWRTPLLGRVLEPYLVGTYAMPLVLFYPFLLVVFGLGATPIVLIAAAMGVIPVILNSWAAFQQVPDIYFKVCASFRCKGSRRFWKVVFPASAPLIFAGFKLCLIYSFVGVIVMEFMVGNIGLGFRVAYDYDGFKIDEMYAYVTIIVALAAVITAILAYEEKRIRGEISNG
ncbi:MAG TPA: ABC transporter permease subunit [Castellaniella sp.]|uniref:ABC transporter permease n=1 Tax=Castellaniella sp. TaxID=1955812 RepID=UPI002F0E40F2